MEAMMTVDATDKELQESIGKAREVLIGLATEEPERWWTPYELKARARNGWGSGVVGLALRELVREGVLQQRRDFCVQLAHH
jgi:hypothetical protein